MVTAQRQKTTEMPTKLIEYRNLLESFLNNGYELSPFIESPPPQQALLLRHDIDFDLQLAREMAAIEHQIGVKSTYFLMLKSASYNLLETENTRLVDQIRADGHQISLHFDPTIYADFQVGLRQELDIFERHFGLSPDCISIHRPTDFFLQYDSPINQIRHTYQSIYCKLIEYCSDSQGLFKHGHPLNSQAYADKRSIHLLVHPIWWVTTEVNSIDILNKFLDLRIQRFQQHMADNCKPYRAVVGGDYD
jgi:hypothetical protein